jgi:hypothetical protein
MYVQNRYKRNRGFYKNNKMRRFGYLHNEEYNYPEDLKIQPIEENTSIVYKSPVNIMIL